MKFTPLAHQVIGRDHLLKYGIAGLFAGMGLGKTAMVLAALDYLIADGACRGALIIAPLRVSLFTWLDEINYWDDFRWMKGVSLRTDEGKAAWEKGSACIYTLNYESLFIPRTVTTMVEDENFGGKVPKMVKDLKTGMMKPEVQIVDHGLLGKLIHGRRATALPVDTIVWDELTKAKNPGSKRIQQFRRYRYKFERHWGLTGTPIPKDHLDLFAQIRLLDDGKAFGTVMKNFKERYFHDINAAKAMLITDPRDRWKCMPKWEIRPDAVGMIEDELGKFVLTLRAEDWLDVPPTTVEDVDVEITAATMKQYKRLQKKLVLMLNDATIKAVNRAVLVGKLLQFTGGAVYAESLDALFDDGGDFIPAATGAVRVVTEVHDAKIKALKALHAEEGKAPMIVAIKFKHERERILRAIPYAKAFDSKLLDDWNAGKIPMLVAHPASMSHGLNMQHGGSRVCWFSMTYDREEYDQFNARVIRQGQKSATKIFRLVISGTVDDAAVATMEHRGAVQGDFMAILARNIKRLAAAG